ncbi:hypothetical protein F0562_018624 [Nyssa sinensis]|uniref:RING-type E3 ubiquitin transferase n=1 Tax=Nyssa sinensis TaxID=561372 RepID=A0A5J4ZB06_9ASTE|nr:hypothetical protein F0562_018624 [Nyssa sinensis]
MPEGAPNAWAPYDRFRDCSQEICTVYCPQWCYYFFPPPPPFDDSGTTISPLIIAVITILVSAFLLVSYYLISKRWRRRRRGGDQNPSPEFESNRDQMNQDPWQVSSTGLDEALIKSITVCKYKKGDGVVEGTECAVCLNEFRDDESLRLLPKCNHAFHVACIDTWLKSHSNCPLCRSNLAAANPLPLPAPISQSSSTLNINSVVVQHQGDLIMVVDDEEMGHQDEVVVTLVNDVTAKNAGQASSNEIGAVGFQQFRRSISLDSLSSQGHLLVADILSVKEDDEDSQITQFPVENGSWKGVQGENSMGDERNGVFDSIRSPFAVKRSNSTGRFIFTRHDKGKNSIIPLEYSDSSCV